MTTAQKTLEWRLHVWREKLALVTAAFDKEPLIASPLAGARAFLYREKYACACIIAELERLSEELQQQ